MQDLEIDDVTIDESDHITTSKTYRRRRRVDVRAQAVASMPAYTIIILTIQPNF